MSFWSGYERSVRHRGPFLKLWVRRARCRRCGASHALVPSFCLVGRLDDVEVLTSAVLTAVVGEARGVRPVAEEADVPHTTARDWVRRFCRRAALVAAAFAAVAEEYTGRFVKIALNVAHRPGSTSNDLHVLLQRWFGPSAGQPGTDHYVDLVKSASGLLLRPAARDAVPAEAEERTA